MNEEKVKITIEIPKNAVGFIISILKDNRNGSVTINSQSYDTDDVMNLIKDSEKMGD